MSLSEHAAGGELKTINVRLSFGEINHPADRNVRSRGLSAKVIDCDDDPQTVLLETLGRLLPKLSFSALSVSGRQPK
jgi:hypothetical protein